MRASWWAVARAQWSAPKANEMKTEDENAINTYGYTRDVPLLDGQKGTRMGYATVTGKAHGWVTKLA